MLVEKWMTKSPVTVNEGDSLATAIRLLKEKRIRRLPVMKDGKLVGIVSDRDLKEASPSKATSLDIWELHFLLEKLTVGAVMTKKVVTITPETTIERAALVMMERKIGGLPVVSADRKLVGILTEDDVFRALVDVTGIQKGKTRISLLIPDRAGSIREVADLCREKGGRIVSILTSYAKVPPGKRELIMRLDGTADGDLKRELSARFGEVAVTRD